MQENYVPVTIKRIRLVDQIAEILSQMIFEGQLKPGEKLVQEKLADMLSVSRTPLREAYRKLEEEGLVHVTASGMIEVLQLDAEGVLDMYDVREVIDGLAARLSAKRINRDELETLEAALNKMRMTDNDPDLSQWARANLEFHMTIARASHNEKLIQVMSPVRMSARMFFPALLSRLVRTAAARQEHAAIFEAIKRGDTETAEASAKLHVINTKEMIRKEMKAGR